MLSEWSHVTPLADCWPQLDHCSLLLGLQHHSPGNGFNRLKSRLVIQGIYKCLQCLLQVHSKMDSTLFSSCSLFLSCMLPTYQGCQGKIPCLHDRSLVFYIEEVGNLWHTESMITKLYWALLSVRDKDRYLISYERAAYLDPKSIQTCTASGFFLQA